MGGEATTVGSVATSPTPYHPAVCDASARLLPGFPLPQAKARRHSGGGKRRPLCARTATRVTHCSRCWRELFRSDGAGIAARVPADRKLARSVARHWAMFVGEIGSTGRKIDGRAAVPGNLLLPPVARRRRLPKTTPASSPPECIARRGRAVRYAHAPARPDREDGRCACTCGWLNSGGPAMAGMLLPTLRPPAAQVPCRAGVPR